MSKNLFQKREKTETHKALAYEQQIIKAVKNGDVEGLKKIREEDYPGSMGKLSDNMLQQERFLYICMITLITRASIDGGILPEEAFAKSDAYISRVETLNTISDIRALCDKAKLDFTSGVRDQRNGKSKCVPVTKCKEYIFIHLHEKLNLEILSEAVSLNKDYLSCLFKRTEKISITQYIQIQKVHEAEDLLRYTDFSLSEISDDLSFSSQSYFGSIFFKHTGMTPQKYRDIYRQF